MKEFVKSITSPYEKELIETRRYLHRHPELSFQETDTAAYIRSTLNALGVPLMEGISGTSTVAVIKGRKTGPGIAFRADIDALPVEEENDLPFKSEVPRRYACLWTRYPYRSPFNLRKGPHSPSRACPRNCEADLSGSRGKAPGRR